ncbi:MAG: outer membrane protein assembly factor BamA [Candidatus Omnitrophica bacterium 4484_70.1]|nr:MAG: outer membrane protein assembly factor BamA [Candidatus Omnitrophica bacterium 4484_70.1]
MRRLFFFVFSFLFLSTVFSRDNLIIRIEIEGNRIVSDSKIISSLKTKVGQLYKEAVVNQDVKSLMDLGYFEKVEAERIDTPEGIIVKFKVKEMPVIKKISIEGNRYIRKRRILEIIGIKEGTFLDEFKVKEAIKKIKEFYLERGFSRVKIKYSLDIDKKSNQAFLKIMIKEGKILKVRKIVIKGNESFSAKRIKKLMRTKRAWLLGRGIFKKETLEDDIERIKDFYRKNGFADVKVDYAWDYLAGGVFVTLNIKEGRKYLIGEIKIEGNKEIPSSEIYRLISLKKGDIYTEEKVKEQVVKVQSLYFDEGYIFARVTPLTYFNPQTERVDVTLKIVENEVSYVEEIIIRGNEKTKDKVIRRELRIYPGDKFSGEKIRKSKRRLENLGFFEEISFDTHPASRPNWQKLIVEVKEKKTGYLSFGGGYSSVDEFVGFVELRQRNFDWRNWKTFTGAGQDLSLYISSGTLTETYELSFTEPWIFDYPVSFGFDGYKKGHKREEDVGYGYEVEARGGRLRLGKEFNDYLRGGISYQLEKVEIRDVPSEATSDLKEEEGKADLSSVEMSISWDRRDNVFDPSQGFYTSLSFQITGGFLGGDKDFLKSLFRFSNYVPIKERSVLELRLRMGIASPFSGTEKVPIYERFFAGGASTIRGYHERKVGPIDPVTEDPVGGEALFVVNLEYIYALNKFLRVATFFDSGNVWKKRGDFLSGGFKSSIGAGLRLKTPIGPISLDYGWPLNKEPGEEKKTGRFHFSISRGF